MTQAVRVDARLDEHLSRWLWLVKWVLLIPHYVVLAFLWFAFSVVWVAALLAILVTGQFPRGLYAFNLGVLRWTWRVAWYGYSGLGTDRYPPFTLAEEPDYPATLDITRPERMSRGLALVSWWVLAAPQYLVLAFLVGGGGWFAGGSASDGRGASLSGGGLIGLLVLFAGVVLLVRDRYPRELFDLVVGLDRWVLRVAAYASLMTDSYPPFRLDPGGREPSPAAPSPVDTTSPAPGPVGPVALPGAVLPAAGGAAGA